MKKIIFGIALAAAAMLSSCENLEPVQDELAGDFVGGVVSGGSSSDGSVVFTAKLGADTKTYMEWSEELQEYQLLWSENDQIFVWDMATLDADEPVGEFCNLTSGAGSNMASFTGTIKSETGYAALYANMYYYPSVGYGIIELPRIQYGTGNIGQTYYPMAAVSETTEFEFKNLGSVLKVSVTGNGERIDSIKVQSNDPAISMSGVAAVDFSGERPSLFMLEGTSLPEVVLSTYTYIYEVPVDFYFSIPAQTYTGGITVSIYTSMGWMEVSTTESLTFEPSQIRSVPAIAYVQEFEFPQSWGLVGEMTDWGSDIVMTEEGDFWVLKEQWLEAWSSFKFRCNADWSVNFGGYESYTDVNVETSLLAGGADMYVTESGYYDIYLDVENAAVYIMTPGSTPNDVATVCWSYDEVAALDDGEVVKVTGYVMATYGYGFVMSVGDADADCVLVYLGTSDFNGYYPAMGNLVEVQAQKKTYRLPELASVTRVNVLSDSEEYFNMVTPLELSAAEFENFTSDRYTYVKVRGNLYNTGVYYNMTVDGVTANRLGSISSPLWDMTDYLDKEVVVEGYFSGLNTGTDGKEYFNMVARKLNVIETFFGSIEDVQ